MNGLRLVTKDSIDRAQTGTVKKCQTGRIFLRLFTYFTIMHGQPIKDNREPRKKISLQLFMT